jgi:predicted nucleic acid-binding protein
MVFIYFLEGHPDFGTRVQNLHKTMLRRGDRLCTSVFTIGEVLIGPRKRNDVEGLRNLKEFFSCPEVEILPFDVSAADRFSIIRANLRVTPPDGIHLATAAAAGVDLFVTNDERLLKLSIPGIRFFSDLDGRIA